MIDCQHGNLFYEDGIMIEMIGNVSLSVMTFRVLVTEIGQERLVIRTGTHSIIMVRTISQVRVEEAFEDVRDYGDVWR